MTTLEIVLVYLLTLSVLGNGLVGAWWWRRRKTREPDVTAQELLHHLSRGPTALRIECVDPSQLWMRRPGA